NDTRDIKDGNNGTANGSLTFVAGKVGQAFNFDGSTFINVPNPSGNLRPAALSIDAWIKPVFAGRPRLLGDVDSIFAKFVGANGYQFFIAQDAVTFSGAPLGTLGFQVNINNSLVTFLSKDTNNNFIK